MLWIVGTVYREFAQYLLDQEIAFGIFAVKPLKRTYGARQVVVLDLMEPDRLRQVLRVQQLPVSSVVALYEQYVLPAAIIAEFYGVPGLPLTTAAACTSKLLMRQKFMELDPSITPPFTAITQLQAALDFAGSRGYPVVLKPSNLMKSLLVTVSRTPDELAVNFRQTMEHLTATSERFRAPPAPLIIEAYMGGTMHTVAAFVDRAGQPQLVPEIVDCTTARDIGQDDNYLFCRWLPSKLDASQQAAVKTVATKAVRALGMRFSAAHVEIMYTPDGPKVIEVGARLGGYRSRMYQLATGIDLYNAQIRTVEDKPLYFEPTQQAYAAALEIFPAQEGRFAGLNRSDLLELPAVNYYHVYAKPGRQVGPAKLGYKATVVVMLSAQNREQLAADCAAMEYQLSVLVD
jgi:formate-dependent phosphoribosylglycinamide formyltransferase (GAR transformylase)